MSRVLHDFRCSNCGAVTEHFEHYSVQRVACPVCDTGVATRVILQTAKPHWAALSQGDNASPEAIARFDRVHQQQKAKEEKTLLEHGDYGPSPGAD